VGSNGDKSFLPEEHSGDQEKKPVAILDCFCFCSHGGLQRDIRPGGHISKNQLRRPFRPPVFPGSLKREQKRPANVRSTAKLNGPVAPVESSSSADSLVESDPIPEALSWPRAQRILLQQVGQFKKTKQQLLARVRLSKKTAKRTFYAARRPK